MAKSGSFSARFPHFKLFVFLALLIALPLTVWSAQNASTTTEQHAATSQYTCLNKTGNYCSPESCSPDKTVSGSCPERRRCCAASPLKTPIITIITSKCIKNLDASKQVEVDVSWPLVAGATKYTTNVYRASNGEWLGQGNHIVGSSRQPSKFFLQSKKSMTIDITLQAKSLTRVSGIASHRYKTVACPSK